MKDRLGWSQMLLFAMLTAVTAPLLFLLYQYAVLRVLFIAAAVLVPVILLERPVFKQKR